MTRHSQRRPLLCRLGWRGYSYWPAVGCNVCDGCGKDEPLAEPGT